MSIILKSEYEALATSSIDLKSDSVSSNLFNIVKTGLPFLLEECEIVPLQSRVPNKDYFSFRKDKKLTRPINKGLFDINTTMEYAEQVLHADISGINHEKLAKVLYTSAMAYCCPIDIVKTNDKKTPGTFFEIFVGHFFAKVYGVNPEKKITIPTLDIELTLPTDFIFHLGEGRNRIHLPVKISTRERVVQVWAHQRVLDGMHGMNRFKGILVCLTETNMQTKTKSVVEVCLPKQWAAYQMYIAQMYRFYYLDVPQRYLDLKKTYPFIQIKHFASFFDEWDTIARADPFS